MNVSRILDTIGKKCRFELYNDITLKQGEFVFALASKDTGILDYFNLVLN